MQLMFDFEYGDGEDVEYFASFLISHWWLWRKQAGVQLTNRAANWKLQGGTQSNQLLHQFSWNILSFQMELVAPLWYQ